MRPARIGAVATLLLASIPVCLGAQGTPQSTLQPRRTRGLPDLSRYGEAGKIDGINVSAYAGFWNDWKLVTVRFRKDNGEQRFVYANPVAWRALRNRAPAYPDGSVLAKVAFIVGDDGAFPNSAEPRQWTRVQLMKKDSRKYPGTNGWGYALITSSAGATPDTDRSAANACHACHRLVPERDYVFSHAIFLGTEAARGEPREFKARFHAIDTASLNTFQRDALSHVLRNERLSALGTVMGVSMELFYGSMSESIGVLARYATGEGRVFALWDEPHARFIVARPLSPSPECKTRAWVAFDARASLERSVAPPQVRLSEVCNGRWASRRAK